MTYTPPLDEVLERDVLAGLACERHRALELYPVLPADVFVAHRLHPYIFGTLRRLHLAGGGAITVEAAPGPDRQPRPVLMVAGFTEVFDASFPKVGAGPALALLRDALDEMAVLWTRDVDRALELRARRRLLEVIDAQMAAGAATLGELHRLDALAARVADPAYGSLALLEADLAELGIELIAWKAPRAA